MDRIHHRLESAMNDIGQVGPTSGFGAASAASRITEASAAYRARSDAA
jgi:hypothetical protein